MFPIKHILRISVVVCLFLLVLVEARRSLAVSIGEGGNEVFETSNVGIGTHTVNGGLLIVKTAGNVGVGTTFPGRTLDVVGNIRASNNGKIIGAASNIANILWVVSGANVYTLDTHNVGMGTSTPRGTFVVNSGNMGVGTFAPIGPLQIRDTAGTQFVVASTGNVGIGTNMTNASTNLAVIGGNMGIGTINGLQAGLSVMNGNVGIGTWVPSNIFQVDRRDAAPFAIDTSGNVGVGTDTPQAALAIMNGHVGIGTVTAEGAGVGLNVRHGNVGVGSATPGRNLDVNGDIRLSGELFGVNTLSIGVVVIGPSNNTACNTACTGPCLMGQDTGGGSNENIEDCKSTRSDFCVCLQ